MSDPYWFDDAACRGMNPDVFFPVRGGSLHEALAACARCPVRVECLEAALVEETNDQIVFGIRGGMSGRERRKLRRQRRRLARV